MRHSLRILLALGVTYGVAHAQSACELIVDIDGFRNTRGVAGGAIFQSTDGWPEASERAFQLAHSPIEDTHAILHFTGLAPGKYAVVVIHDENSNKRLDRNLFRVPKEGFGFANNPHVTFSPPSFDAAAIQVTCPETTIKIGLIYK
jgi:uncharacterized protein (DUF2141 family)